MATVDVKTSDGGATGRTIELADEVFGIQPNVPVMHQVVTAQLAAARAGTQSTLTRAEVRGGGAKPYRQKGTGRARQGSTRAPHFAGGGVALGPKPRSYRQKTPKKMVQLALRSALSDRANENKIVVIDDWKFEAPKTKDAVAAIDALGLDGKILVVIGREDEVTYKSFRNLPEIQLLLAPELNCYDILCSDWIVFTEETLPGGSTAATTPSAEVPMPAAPAEPEAAAEPAGDTEADETEDGDSK